MRKALVVLAGVAALSAVPAAQAKEMKFQVLRICGAAGCSAFRPAVSVDRIHGFAPAAVPPLGPYYVLEIAFRDERGKLFGRQELYFVASGGIVNGKDLPGLTGGWARLPKRALPRVGDAAGKMRPFATPAPARAVVNGKAAPDPAAFAALLGPLERAATPRNGEQLSWITLSWATPNPWARDGAILEYLPTSRVVIRPDGTFRVPGPLADRIDRVRRGP